MRTVIVRKFAVVLAVLTLCLGGAGQVHAAESEMKMGTQEARHYLQDVLSRNERWGKPDVALSIAPKAPAS
ncbi:MAG: hypothetical protein WCS43_18670 [Verrucomicrobiota bacterium]